jgi:hypothetical protein
VSCVPNNVTVSGLSFVIDPSVFSNDYLLEDVFDNISLTTNDIKLRNVQHKPLHNILSTNIFLWLRYGLHNLISTTSVMKPQTQCYTIFGYAPTVDIVWQQVKVLLEKYI